LAEVAAAAAADQTDAPSCTKDALEAAFGNVLETRDGDSRRTSHVAARLKALQERIQRHAAAGGEHRWRFTRGRSLVRSQVPINALVVTGERTLAQANGHAAYRGRDYAASTVVSDSTSAGKIAVSRK
jgi:hypothetical protein